MTPLVGGVHGLAFQDPVVDDVLGPLCVFVAAESIDVGVIFGIRLFQVEKLSVLPVSESQPHFPVLTFVQKLFEHKLVFQDSQDQGGARMHELKTIGPAVALWVYSENLPCLSQTFLLRGVQQYLLRLVVSRS